jgi:hypothetical protein
MSTSRRFLPPIPNDSQIFWGEVEVAGIQHNLAEVAAFINGTDHQIHLHAEPENPHDPNAIAVHGSIKGLFGRKRKMLGYVPAGIANAIVDEALGSLIQPRLRNLYLGDHDFAVVQFDLLGPKECHQKFTERMARKDVEDATVGGEFAIPPSNVEKNILGMSCEKAGDVERAVLCYEACIRNSFEGNFPYDRLLAIYRKRKDLKNETRVAEKAVRVFERVASSGRLDGEPKLRKYRERLARLQPSS